MLLAKYVDLFIQASTILRKTESLAQINIGPSVHRTFEIKNIYLPIYKNSICIQTQINYIH